jgi:flagellar protein FliO/FliZ
MKLAPSLLPTSLLCLLFLTLNTNVLASIANNAIDHTNNSTQSQIVTTHPNVPTVSLVVPTTAPTTTITAPAPLAASVIATATPASVIATTAMASAPAITPLPASAAAASSANTGSVLTTTPHLRDVSSINTSAPGNLLQVIVSLMLVLGVLFAASWAVKKWGIRGIASGLPVRIIGAISIGSNQRIVVLEAGESWIVLGVTPQQISTITTLPKQESSSASKPDFSAWLHQSLEKYHVKKT